jgi:hypothetical protein
MNTRLLPRLAIAVSLLLTLAAWVAADPPGDPGDGRKVLPNTSGTPAKYVGLLYYEDPRPLADRPETKGRIRTGTAFLVGEKHIVTCAHVITDNPSYARKNNYKPYPDKFPKKMYFAPGHHGPVETPLDGPATPLSQPFGRYEIVNVTQIFTKFFTEEMGAFGDFPIGRYDLVVLELDRSTQPTVGGHFQFQHSFVDLDNDTNGLNVNGYDADRAGVELLANNNERMALWQMTRVGNVPKAGNLGPRLFQQARLTCKAYPGASGSPIWVLQNDVPTVVGIVRGMNDGDNLAIGLLFREEHTKFIEAGLQVK